MEAFLCKDIIKDAFVQPNEDGDPRVWCEPIPSAIFCICISAPLSYKAVPLEGQQRLWSIAARIIMIVAVIVPWA